MSRRLGISGSGRAIGAAALLAFCTAWGADSAHAADDGFVPIFDGKSLDGWDGNPDFWRVEDGSITGETTKEKPTKGNTFIIWRKADVADFELKLEYKIVGGNSGIQYRSFEVPGQKWVVGGNQADFEAGKTYSGILYGEKARGIVAKRGEQVTIGQDGKPKVTGSVGDTNEIQAKIKNEDWNEYHISAIGNRYVHKINGLTTVDVTDEDIEGPARRRASGILALQLHAGPPMKVQFRNIRLKTVGAAKGAAVDGAKSAVQVVAAGQPVLVADADGVRVEVAGVKVGLAPGGIGVQVRDQVQVELRRGGAEQGAGLQVDVPGAVRVALAQGATATAGVGVQAGGAKPKKIVFLAGRPSHGFGAHEHNAGCMLLAKALNESGLPVVAEVHTNGWPKDASVLNDADCIVSYADGGGGHPFNAHLEDLAPLMKKGVGMVCIHYAVEVPKGKSGEAFLNWIGGYFEMNWSVNPHWTASYKELPKHEIARGVKPFSVNDEWYYHMRFREQMENVVPILTDVPPASTLTRPDGPHSGNPDVRKEAGKPQHTAWASTRPDGGRGFGITGGHVHWNWGHDQFRKLVLNAVVWSAKGEVPANGVPSKSLTAADLEANQDEPVPANHNRARIQQMLDEWNATAAATPATSSK